MNLTLAKKQIKDAIEQYDDGALTRASLDVVIDQTLVAVAGVQAIVPVAEKPHYVIELEDDYADDDDDDDFDGDGDYDDDDLFDFEEEDDDVD